MHLNALAAQTPSSSELHGCQRKCVNDRLHSRSIAVEGTQRPSNSTKCTAAGVVEWPQDVNEVHCPKCTQVVHCTQSAAPVCNFSVCLKHRRRRWSLHCSSYAPLARQEFVCIVIASGKTCNRLQQLSSAFFLCNSLLLASVFPSGDPHETKVPLCTFPYLCIF